MRKLLLLSMLSLWPGIYAPAQGFKWVRGGGGGGSPTVSSDLEAVTNLVTDDNGNTYGAARISGLSVQLDTFSRTLQYGGSNVVQLLLFSYGCQGQLRWAKLIESNGLTYVNGLAYGSGKVYVSGNMNGSNKRIGGDTAINGLFNQSAFVLSCDTGGSYQWLRFVGSNTTGNNNLTSAMEGVLKTDGQGKVHYIKYLLAGVQISPSVTSTTGTYDLVYDGQGLLQSALRLDLDSSWIVADAAIDRQTGKLYARGYHNPNLVNTYAGFLSGFTASRSRLWIDSVSDPVYYPGLGNMTSDNKGHLYVLGSAYNTFSYQSMTVNSAFNPGNVAVVFKVDSNGNPVWMKPYSSPFSATLFGIQYYGGNKIAACGLFTNRVASGTDTVVSPSGQGQNSFFSVLDTAGTLVALKQIEGNGNSDRANAVTADGNNSLYIGGDFGSDVWADTLSPLVSLGGTTDLFVMKYGYDCGAGCNPPVPAFTFSIDTPDKKISLAYTGSMPVDSLRWQFGDGQSGSNNSVAHLYADTGTYRVCVYAYNACGVDSFCQNIHIPGDMGVGTLAVFRDLRVYPNPVQDKLQIEGAKPGMTASLYSVAGALIRELVLRQDREQLDMSALPQGTYLLQLKDADGRKAGTLILKQ